VEVIITAEYKQDPEDDRKKQQDLTPGSILHELELAVQMG
jgi:hypothetical protein